jgi:hypothetical protein
MGYFFFTNCCLNATNGLVGTGNIAATPKFADVPGGDFRLTGSSPCVNAGMNQAWMTGAFDLDGNPRIDTVWGVVDMGCYEYVPGGTLITVR